MKVLHLSSEYPPAKVYGLGRFVHGLARAQVAQGDEVFVLTNSTGGAEDDTIKEGVRLHRIAFPNPPRPADGHGEVLQFNHGLIARFLDRRAAFEGVDVVASHDWLTAIAAREIARELERPLVVTFHDEVHGKNFGLLDREACFVRDLEALTAHDATRVIANSRFVAEQVVRHYGVPAERIVAIPGGIDPAVVRVRSRERVADFRAAIAEPGEVLVTYVGRLDQEKGLLVLADAVRSAAARCPGLRIAIAGTGKHEAALRDALAPLGRRASFLGYVTGERLAYLYASSDIVVVPSIYEPFGLVALEAMAAEVAVIVAGSGGLAEIVRDGKDGRVVPPADAEAVAEAILELADDHAYRRKLAEAGLERVRTEFSWSEIARRTRDVYEEARSQQRPVSDRAPELPARPLVSVTIVTHEAPVHVETCLRSLFARTEYPALEAIVVENGSSPASVARLERVIDELRALGAAITLLKNERNRLFSAGQNQAIGAAKGDYVCLLNDDTEVPPGSEGWLAALVWALETLPDAGTVTPVTLQRDGKIYCAGAYGGGGHVLKDVLDRPDIVTAPHRTEWNNMACLLARRHLFEQAGPLEEEGELAHYGSDRDWCLRVREELGLAHWVHSVRLFHFEKEARRAPPPAFQATVDTRIPASIVVVAYGQLAFTRKAIDAVLAYTTPPFELVLIDNGSPDETRSYFRELRDRLGGRVAVQVIENEDNLGYAKAANQGLRAARGRHVVLLNNDAEVRAGWLGALLDAAASEARVGIVTPKILSPDLRVQNAGGIIHHPDGSFTLPHAHEDRLAPTVTRRRAVDNASGPSMLLTRALLDEVGVFDEAYSPAYFEDSDLCLRARERGFTLLYEPRAEVVHVGKATADQVAREGKLDLWGKFEENKRRFYGRWRSRLASDALGRTPVVEKIARKRILLCANNDPISTAAYVARALRRDHDVVTAGRGQDIDLGRPATARELCELAGGGIDLLLVVEGDNYFPRGLEESPCPSAWWAIDNHIHAGPDGVHFELAREFDHVFVAQRDYVPAFQSRGITATWLPLACEPDAHVRPAATRDLDVVFVGHVLPIHRRRRALLDRLKQRFRVEERQRVYGEEMAELLGRAKVVWNCSLAGDLNMRVFEGLASGGLLVTDRIANGLEELFADQEHLLLYDDGSLEEVVARALADERLRSEVGARGQRLVTRHHTYVHRMRELVRAVSAAPDRKEVAT